MRNYAVGAPHWLLKQCSTREIFVEMQKLRYAYIFNRSFDSNLSLAVAAVAATFLVAIVEVPPPYPPPPP